MFNLTFLANPEKPNADDRIDSAVHMLRGKRVAAELSLLKLGLRLWCVFFKISKVLHELWPT